MLFECLYNTTCVMVCIVPAFRVQPLFSAHIHGYEKSIQYCVRHLYRFFRAENYFNYLLISNTVTTVFHSSLNLIQRCVSFNYLLISNTVTTVFHSSLNLIQRCVSFNYLLISDPVTTVFHSSLNLIQRCVSFSEQLHQQRHAIC